MIKESYICPQCGSRDIAVDGSLIEASIGAKVCKKCGYKAIAFPIKSNIGGKSK